MSKKKLKKKNSKKKVTTNPLNELKHFFTDRHPIFKFMLGFISCMVVFYLFYYSDFFKNNLEVPFLEAQARISNLFLNLLGHDTTVNEASISSTEYTVNIKNGCDGLEAIAILISGILIFPTSFRLKIPGIIWGGFTLIILNLFRIAGLYLVGLNFSPEVFEVLHIQGGFILFTMISVILLFVWMNWVMKKSPK